MLALEDGTVFIGSSFGAVDTQTGEVVFNTAMTGYQEILTDPSYCGQIVTMTSPQIGNYGINPKDIEAAKLFVSGLVIKDLSHVPSNYRSTASLHDYLKHHEIIGLQGIDTRALTRKLRTVGSMRGCLTSELDDPAEAVRRAKEAPCMVGADLVKVVAPKEDTIWSEGLNKTFTQSRQLPEKTHRIVAIDCGMKRNILRHLVDLGCEVHVVPPTFTADQVLDYQPDGVFVSNGPGDPAAVSYAIDLLKNLIGLKPIFGICLGHQLLGLALGAKTYKLKFGHHGVNHPVMNLQTRSVEITSQNHGFAIDVASLESVGGKPTHLNLNDQTLEGFVHPDQAILALQYHPEASPGPHDAVYLFDVFQKMMETGQAPSGEEMASAQRQYRSSQSNPSAHKKRPVLL